MKYLLLPIILIVGALIICTTYKLTNTVPSKLSNKEFKNLKRIRNLLKSHGAIGESILTIPEPANNGLQEKPWLIEIVQGYSKLYGTSSFSYGGRNVERVADYIKNACNIKKIISFDKLSFEYEKQALGPTVKYVEYPIEDYTGPPIESIDIMILELCKSGDANIITAMHCAAGRGRTGFMVAILLSILHLVHISDAIKLIGSEYSMLAMEEVLNSRNQFESNLLNSRILTWSKWIENTSLK